MPVSATIVKVEEVAEDAISIRVRFFNSDTGKEVFKDVVFTADELPATGLKKYVADKIRSYGVKLKTIGGLRQKIETALSQSGEITI